MAALFAAVIAATLAMVSPLVAQDVTGTVQGVVADPSGAVIPGVEVELVNETTGGGVRQSSNAEGRYLFNLVAPGRYSVRASSPGFRNALVSGIVVEVARNVRADIVLQLGPVAEQIEVTTEVPRIDAVSAQVSTNVERQMMINLPSLGRNSLTFAELAPGVSVSNRDSQVLNIEGTYANVNNNRRGRSVYYLDGSDNTGSFRNSALQFPNPEAIQEVTVSTSSTSAEFGKQSGGVFNVVTKSGTNNLHGSGFYFFRHDKLNANDFERNRTGQPRPPAPLKQAGGTLGGPVIRNKTFFFTSYQHYRDEAPRLQNTVRFPTQAMVNGDFSAFGQQLYDPDTREPLPGNVIPASLLSPVARNLMDLIPTVPNFGDRYVWSFADTVRSNEMLFKGDHIFNEKHNITATYMRSWGTQTLPSGAPNMNVPQFGPQLNDSVQNTASVRHNWVASPNIVIQNRFGLARHSADRGNANLGRNLGDFGAAWAETQSGARKYLPQVRVSDSFFTHQGWLSLFQQWNYRFGSTATWVKGSHNLKFGAEFQRDTVRQRNDQDGANFNFDGRASSLGRGTGAFGFAMADYFMGRVSTFSASGILDYNLYNWSDFFFIQDQWRVSPRLTLTPGLRYELYTPAAESDNRASAFRYGHRSNVYPNAPLHLAFLADSAIPPGFFDQDRNNFAPRLGLAYDLFGDSKSVVRGGFGYYFSYNSTQIKMWNAEGPPWRPSASGGEALFEDPWRTSKMVVYQEPPIPYTADVSNFPYPPRLNNIVGFNDNFRTPYMGQWNVTFAQALTKDITVEAGYIGNRGVKLLQMLPGNLPLWRDDASLGNIEARRPINGYGHVSMIHSRALSWYNAFQLVSDVRIARNFNSRMHYTYGRSYDLIGDDPTGNGNIQTANPLNLDGERALSGRNHVFRGFYVYDLPFFQNDTGWLRRMLGGWQASGILSLQSGPPINVTLGEDWNFDSAGGDRPNLASSIGYTSGSTDTRQAKWFDTSVFERPAIRNTFGNLPRNALFGPGRWDVDFAMYKNFAFTETRKFQLRAEAYNLFNHANLNNPNTDMRSVDFGRILTRSGNRQMQIGLRFEF
jgi:hypothetical protein